MSTIEHLQDIFLWPDGYWCFRENFHTQPRQTYDYVLVEINGEQWKALHALAPVNSMSAPKQAANDKTN